MIMVIGMLMTMVIIVTVILVPGEEKREKGEKSNSLSTSVVAGL